jgi:acetyl esterase/lipase
MWVVGAQCVVISVNYRLAPEHPYPAAVEDATAALIWTATEAPSLLSIDTRKIAVGGSSSGGNLAAILALAAPSLSLPHPVIFQLLIVPVTDNTLDVSSPDSSWSENAETPWLGPERMRWFRDNYLPPGVDRAQWEVSPHFAPEELIKGVPDAWIGVGELDILRDEGVKFGERLREAGKEVEVVVYPGAPHPIMAMDG